MTIATLERPEVKVTRHDGGSRTAEFKSGHTLSDYLADTGTVLAESETAIANGISIDDLNTVVVEPMEFTIVPEVING